MSYGVPRPPAGKTDSYEFKNWFSRIFGFTQEERGIKSVSAAYAVEAGIRHIRCDASAGGFTVTLPAATDFTGRPLSFIKTDSSGNTVTLKASDSMNGTVIQSIATQYGVINARSTGSTWDKI